jgi:signal transduction histidine kinase
MLKSLKNTSISTQYLIFATTLPIILLIISLTSSYLDYKEIQKTKHNNYWHQADKIFDIIENGFHYILETSASLDQSISHFNNIRAEKVNKTFKNYFNNTSNKKEKFLVKYFQLISPEGEIIAQSKPNLTHESFFTFPDYLAWSNKARTHPQHLIILEPSPLNTLDNINSPFYINTIWGITNKQNKFLGYILATLDLQEITSLIQKALKGEGIDFLLLDKTNRIIASSKQNETIPTNYFTNLLSKVQYSYADAGILAKPITLLNHQYNYYRNLRPYSFTVLLGINNKERISLFNKTNFFHLLQALGNCIFLIGFLYFLRLRLINPIVTLSGKALELSQGSSSLEIPSFSNHSIEVNHLANALLLVKNTFTREKLIKEDLQSTKELLEIALNEVNEAKRVKILFVSTLVNEITTPLRFILTHAQAKLTVENDDEQEKDTWQKIYTTSDFINNLVLDLQNYTTSEEEQITLTEKVVNLEKIFNDIIDILQSHINEWNLQLIISLAENAKELKADELKIKQILLNILNYLFNDALPEDQIIIETKIGKGLEINFLRTRTSTILTNKTLPFSSLHNDTYQANFFSVSIARKLVELHEGTLKLDHILDIGKTIKIEFPAFRTVLQKLSN